MNKFLYNNSFWYRGSRHAVFFISMVLLFSFVLFNQHRDDAYFTYLKVTFVNALFFFGYAYITIFVLIPELLMKRKLMLFLLLFILTGFGLSAVKLTVSDTIFYASISPGIISESGMMDLRYIVVNTKDMTFIVAVLSIAKYVKDYLYAERIRIKLEEQSRQSQQKLLQSQFDPHFLFNTINNLYALSLLNPEKTLEVIHRIRIVLNYIIDESQKELVELKDEIALVENYIQLEKLRYGKRLRVALRTVGQLEGVQIPPLILFLLVENCFRHGSSMDAGIPWIEIDVETDSDKVRLHASNSKPRTVPEAESEFRTGQSLRNLQKRLDILYQKDNYNLTITSQEQLFTVVLELKKHLEFIRTTYR